MSETNPRARRSAAVTRKEFEQLEADLHALKEQLEQAATERTRTLTLVEALHNALMVPSPGQGNKSLLDRMAAVTISIESGNRVTGWLIAGAGFIAAIGAAFSALKWGVK